MGFFHLTGQDNRRWEAAEFAALASWFTAAPGGTVCPQKFQWSKQAGLVPCYGVGPWHLASDSWVSAQLGFRFGSCKPAPWLSVFCSNKVLCFHSFLSTPQTGKQIVQWLVNTSCLCTFSSEVGQVEKGILRPMPWTLEREEVEPRRPLIQRWEVGFSLMLRGDVREGQTEGGRAWPLLIP